MSARLKSLAYRLLGSYADAEDVVAEAQLKLLQLENKPEVEEAYLYRMVSNLCVDRLRAEKIRRNTAEVLERSERSGVLPREAARALARERVHEAMALQRSF